MAGILRRAARIVDRADPYIKAAERLSGLTSASHPLALASIAISIGRDLLTGSTKAEARPVCIDADGTALDAICEAASAAGVGRVIGEPTTGLVLREHEGCEWGHSAWLRVGPYGDPSVLPRVAWETLGAAIEVTAAKSRHGTAVQLRRDPLNAAAPCALAEQVAADAVALRAAREPVGILLYGPPGTGKSMIARWVAQQLGGYSLRARLAVGASPLQGLVQVLAPRALILDDLDGSGDTRAALDLAESITASGCAVIVTANDTGAIDPALLRARRLGLHYHVDGIDPAVLDHVLAGLDVAADVRQALGRSTVAVARDYAGHHRALGSERAIALLRAREVGGHG